MAQFYADIQGNRGGATRMGSKSSGLRGHLRGWDIGVRISLRHIDGKDWIQVYKTNGSNGSAHTSGELIAEFTA